MCQNAKCIYSLRAGHKVERGKAVKTAWQRFQQNICAPANFNFPQLRVPIKRGYFPKYSAVKVPIQCNNVYA
jgi:hypothetical protein